MGIFRAFKDSIASTFADQWKEIVTAGIFDEHTLVAPGILKLRDNGRGTNNPSSEGIISNGSKIFVPENTAAVVFNQSAIENIVTIPGGYEYLDGDESVFNGDGLIKPITKQIRKRFGFGGISSDSKQIAFINLREIRNIKFGTAGAQVYHDSERQANANQVKVTVASKDLQGKQYEEAVAALKEMGFIHVCADALDDLSNEIFNKNGEVSKVSIGDITKFSKGEIFDNTTEVIVFYHSPKSKEVAASGDKAVDGQVLITVAPKELKRKDYHEVLSTLQEMGFTNITVTPLGDLKKGWLHDEGEVKEVSIEGNSKFSVNDIFSDDSEIIVFYHSFPTE